MHTDNTLTSSLLFTMLRSQFRRNLTVSACPASQARRNGVFPFWIHDEQAVNKLYHVISHQDTFIKSFNSWNIHMKQGKRCTYIACERQLAGIKLQTSHWPPFSQWYHGLLDSTSRAHSHSPSQQRNVLAACYPTNVQDNLVSCEMNLHQQASLRFLCCRLVKTMPWQQ